MLLKKLALNLVGALNLIFVKILMGGGLDKWSGYTYVSSFIIIAVTQPPKKIICSEQSGPRDSFDIST